MKKVCEKCGREFEDNIKKCPICSKKLKKVYSEEELKELQKQAEDAAAAVNMMWFNGMN